MSTRIHCISLPVEDLARSLKFYQEGLGIAPDTAIELEEGQDHQTLEMDGSLYLVLIVRPEFEVFTDGAGTEVARPGVNECILSHFAPSEVEVDALLAAGVKAGGRLVTSAKQEAWGYTGFITDPDGHLWEILWNQGMSEHLAKGG